MSKKNHIPGPIPAGNQQHAGAGHQSQDQNGQTHPSNANGFQEEDPKRRLGDYTGTGEHSIQQPGPRNDGGQKHSEN